MRPIAVIITACFVAAVSACGCYGPCSLPPTLPCEGGAPGQVNETACICDCCPACNSCDQLFKGCHSEKWQNDLTLSPMVPSSIALGMAVNSQLLRNGTGALNYFLGVCVQPTLPAGLSLTLNSTNGSVALLGTPTTSSALADYTIIAKGGVNYIGTMTLQLSVV